LDEGDEGPLKDSSRFDDVSDLSTDFRFSPDSDFEDRTLAESSRSVPLRPLRKRKCTNIVYCIFMVYKKEGKEKRKLCLLIFFVRQRPLVPLLLLDTPFFLIIRFGSTTLLTGMTGNSLHMQWPLTFAC
jgi:hypothetical protein